MSAESDIVPVNSLPTLSDKIGGFLGFQIPNIPLVKTMANLDKALSALVVSGLGNLTARFEASNAVIKAKGNANAHVVIATSEFATSQIGVHSEISNRAMQFAFGESVLKQKNRENIFKLTAENIKDNPPKEDAKKEIDVDWLAEFSDIAARKSNEDIQILWSKILAGEIRQPGTFSLFSLRALSGIDANSAKLIHSVLSNVVSNIFIFRNARKEDISDIIKCESLGVLSGSAGGLLKAYKYKANEPIKFRIGNRFVLIVPSQNGICQIPDYPLTQFGIELYNLSNDYVVNEEYVQNFINFLKGFPFEIFQANSDGTVLSEWERVN